MRVEGKTTSLTTYTYSITGYEEEAAAGGLSHELTDAWGRRGRTRAPRDIIMTGSVSEEE